MGCLGGSYLLDLFSFYNGIISTYFLGPQLSVVKRALVFIAVTMDPAIQTPTSARETGQADFLFTRSTFILFLFTELLI